MAASNYEAAISLIDEAHAQDPKITIVDGHDVPYELHYAKKMTHYLSLRAPSASPILKVAIRAQHFRRWEIPRDSYPMTKAGYLSWRTFLKKRQADLASAICIGCNFTTEEAEEVAKLIRKEDLKRNKETQILEDVACLVFLDDQFEAFEKEVGDEVKIVNILRKTWGKMSERGHELALEIPMQERSRELIGRALAG
jgi:NTP pyrophosphatase (non-canonical NTP hydrolase)